MMMAEIFATRSTEVEQREIDHKRLARELAGECMVLLENDGTLPLQTAGNIALYGNGARRTIKGGTGSGEVNTRDNVTIEEGFVHAGYTVTTESWLKRQEEKVARDKEAYLAWAEEEAARRKAPVFTVAFDQPYHEPAPVLITEEDIKHSDTDTAVYVIARNSGEGADRSCEPGDYLLFDEEKQNLKALAGAYDKVVVVLNIGGVMDLGAVLEIKGIGAVLLMNQLGNIGGDALLDVLTGRVNPSGKTADTWAKDYQDYPSSKLFRDEKSAHDAFYTEGVYVGYRYFDTFDVAPQYCFGYGKSYTTFAIRTEEVRQNRDCMEVVVTVQNIGTEYAGKEVVQVYATAPGNVIDRPYQELVAYRKTKLLAPGEVQRITFSFPVRNLACYVTEQAAWILEQGDYILRVGSSSRDTQAAAVLTVEEEKVIRKGENLFAAGVPFTEITPDAKKLAERRRTGVSDDTTHIVLDGTGISTEQIHYQGAREEYRTKQTGKLTAADVRAGRCTVEELVSQLTVEELAQLCVGTLRADNDSVVGNASYCVPGAAGDTTSILRESRGIEGLILADGPAGLRLQPHFKTKKDGTLLPGGEGMGDSFAPFAPDLDPAEVDDYYQYCTAIPIGWALAQSWNEELVAQAGDMVGAEMEQFHVDLWLAPALNIHRNPLCGRNFEYYSEDPVLSGKTAAAMTNGVQKHPGKGTTIKHFAVNNQEENRYFTNAHVSERALREIYLRGFEIAVKESHPFSIMTSYNLLNGVHTANHHALIQGMARDEWGFDGVVMTDWFTSQEVPLITGKYKAKYPISASTGCIYAGNDIQMPGCQKNVDDLVEAVRTGEEKDGYTITLADLQFNAANVVRIALKKNERQESRLRP